MFGLFLLYLVDFKILPMKTKLLFGFMLIFFVGYSQQPIPNFNMTAVEDFFTLYTSDNPLDQTVSGANAVWTFNGLNEIGSAVYVQTAPESSEIADFPGSTQKLSHLEQLNDMPSTTNIFYKNPANAVSLTGVSSEGLMLNYNTNNAFIGTYPLEYGFNTSDAVAGNYEYGDYAGTFSGTVATSVDAFGTVNSDVTEMIAMTGTRMKTQQTLSMNYSVFTNVGTFTQTIWSYYNDMNAGHLDWRITTTSVVIGLLGIDETTTIIERYLPTLGTKNWKSASDVAIFPNPVENVLNVQTNGNQKIKSLVLTDVTGKTVFQTNSIENSVDVSQLSKGIYFTAITTDSGTSTQKIIKK